MSPTTSIGLIGCGRWGVNILRDLVTLGCGVHVVARSEASVDRATQGGASTVCTEVDALPDVDGYVVAVPTVDHADTVMELLGRSRPIFVEKPLATQVESARILAGEPSVFVMDKWRYHPGVVALRDLTRSGRYGRPSLIATTRHSLFNPHRDVDAVWVLAPHDLAIVVEILGRLPSAKWAAGESDGIDASLFGVVADDVSVTLDVSSHAAGFRREVRVVYESAVAVLGDGYADSIEVLVSEPGVEPTREPIPIPADMPLLLELRAFVEHVKGGPPPRSSAAVGASIVERIAELRTMAGLM